MDRDSKPYAEEENRVSICERINDDDGDHALSHLQLNTMSLIPIRNIAIVVFVCIS